MVRVEPVRELVSVLIKKGAVNRAGPVELARLILETGGDPVQQNAFLWWRAQRGLTMRISSQQKTQRALNTIAFAAEKGDVKCVCSLSLLAW